MSVFIVCLYVVEVVVCLLLALVVMLQKPKEGGLGGAIGGGMLEASLGADAGNILIKTTAVLGAIFLANTLVLARVTAVHGGGSKMQNERPAAPAMALPEVAPDLAAEPVAAEPVTTEAEAPKPEPAK